MKPKTLLHLGLVAVLSGCASVPDHVAIDTLDHVKKIVVVSAVGDEFVRSYIGVTAFGNEYHKKNVADWGLDREYEEQLAGAARQLHGLTVVLNGADRAAFGKYDKFASSSQWEKIGPALKQQCTTSGVDGVLVLVKEENDRGVGVWVSRPDHLRKVGIAALLALYDCSTGKVVASHLLETGPAAGFKRQWPSMELPEQWPLDGEWDAATYQEAHDELVKLPKQAWAYTLRQMFVSK